MSLVDNLEIRGDKTNVGLVSFSDDAKVEFQLNTYQKKQDIKQVSFSVTNVFSWSCISRFIS